MNECYSRISIYLCLSAIAYLQALMLKWKIVLDTDGAVPDLYIVQNSIAWVAPLLNQFCVLCTHNTMILSLQLCSAPSSLLPIIASFCPGWLIICYRSSHNISLTANYKQLWAYRGFPTHNWCLMALLFSHIRDFPTRYHMHVGHRYLYMCTCGSPFFTD